MASTASRVLVYGGKGALGSSIISHFKAQKWWVASIDMRENEEADSNVIVAPCESWTDQEAAVCDKVAEVLAGVKVDAILCVAGGWAGGNAASKDLVKNADMMCKQSLWTSVIAAHLAAKHLNEGGALVLTGAQPALKGTAGMIGYGLAKAAVHQLVKSLAEDNSGLPSNAFVSAILPITLDTPMNRKFMPDADHTTWTPLEFVADLLFKWSTNKDRTTNGALVQLVTKASKTELLPDA